MQGIVASGNHSCPTVLLLHSSMSNARQWRELVEALEPDYQVINVDLLGYGRAPAADKHTGFSLQDEVERIEQAISDFSIQRFHLVGHSYGGAVALKLAYERPNNIASLILFEPVAFHLLDKSHPGFAEVSELGAVMPELSAEEAAQRFVDYWNGNGFFQSVSPSMQALFTRQVPKVALDFQALMNESYSFDDYAAIEAPTLLMSGKQTRESARAVAEGLLQFQPQWRHLQVSGGHMSPISHTAEVNRPILAWLEQHKAL